MKTPYQIDDQIKQLEKGTPRLRLHGRFINLDQALKFGRRALQIAIEDGRVMSRFSPGDQIKRRSRASHLADRAYKAIDRLIRHLGPDALLDPVVVHPIFRKQGNSNRLLGNLPLMSPDEASSAAATLSGARDLVGKIEDLARQQRKFLAGEHRNEGDPGKRAFVYVLAEAWITLVGRAPGLSRDAVSNPFLRFVDAAWTDADLDADEDFSSALNQALQRFIMRAWETSPDWETVEKIAKYGPIWERQ